MADVVAEMIWHVATMKPETVDLRRLDIVRSLRAEADACDWVSLTMTAPVARMLAADLEELTMLRVVPPTGEAG